MAVGARRSAKTSSHTQRVSASGKAEAERLIALCLLLCVYHVQVSHLVRKKSLM